MSDFEYQIEEFMLYCTSKNLARKTLASYEQTLKLFSLFLSKELNIESVQEVKTNHIRQYIRYLQERGKYTISSQSVQEKYNKPQNRGDYKKQISSTTIANYIRNIKVFFNWLYSEREIKVNPCLKIENIKTDRKCKKLIEPYELKSILEAFNKSIFSGFRNYIITKLLLDCGCRITECLNIQIGDLDIKHNTALISNPKNRKQRYVYFSPKLAKELSQWLRFKDRYIESDYLFPPNRGSILSIHNYGKNLRETGKKVGINIHSHQLRNNFAKYYILNGGDWFTLSRIMGHSSVDVTQKAYLDFTDEEVAKKYQKHSPLMFMNL